MEITLELNTRELYALACRAVRQFMAGTSELGFYLLYLQTYDAGHDVLAAAWKSYLNS